MCSLYLFVFHNLLWGAGSQSLRLLPPRQGVWSMPRVLPGVEMVGWGLSSAVQGHSLFPLLHPAA